MTKTPTISGTLSLAWPKSPRLLRVIRLRGVLLLSLVAVIPGLIWAQSQQPTKLTGSEIIPQPAVPAILAAFDKYEVVAMPEAHGNEDMDNFIFSLIRTPAFSEKVNDIVVECGNSLYQPILDRYIAGEAVPFTEVQKVWRNTTQPMCGTSGFFEQFFSLVRAINQKLPPGRRLRVLAGDPPVDWDLVKSRQDMMKFLNRNPSIASVMEKEVLSKHRKALMLFGTFHLMHGVGEDSGNAVTIYEKDYPNRTFVISDLGDFDTNLSDLSKSPFATWPIPSLALTKDTWLGALPSSEVLPPSIRVDMDCNVSYDFPKNAQKPMADLVDAFLYLGPQDLRLKEQMPADIAVDVDYITELERREALVGFPGTGTETIKQFDQRIVKGAENPLIVTWKPDLKRMRQNCLDRKNRNSKPQ